MIWTFHQASHIPGMPGGDFSNCRVDVHEDGTHTVLPLYPVADEPPDNDAAKPEDAATEPIAVPVAPETQP